MFKLIGKSGFQLLKAENLTAIRFFALIISVLGLILFFLVFVFDRSADLFSLVKAQESPDAIALRVVPNSDHFSANRWYREQAFGGSPQSLTVDGYRAVRDGRTVYVNAGNVSGNSLETNIYVISYNQQAEKTIMDIFGQILSHWNFNTNLPAAGNCLKAAETACAGDSDCPDNDFCGSAKSKVIRDTRRLEDFADLESALEEYKNENGQYPTLPAGSYLPYATMSAWPSWQETLGHYLKGASLPIDPINRLGDCGDDRFNPITCWDEYSQKFAGAIPDRLPAGSHAYVYIAEDSHEYYLCAFWESDYGNLPESCSSNTSGNRPPVFIGSSLTGWPYQEFQGYVRASDPDGDPLTWSLDTSASSWPAWSPAPAMQSIFGVNDQIGIYSLQAGLVGDYPITVRVADSRGLYSEETFTVLITPYRMELSSISDSFIIGKNNLSWALSGTDASKNPLVSINFNSAFFNGDGLSQPLLTSHGFNLAGMSLNENYTASQRTGDYVVNVYALDPSVGTLINSFFSITVANNPPEITSFPEINNIIGSPVDISVEAFDPDMHNFSYAISSMPSGANLSIDSSGHITGIPNLYTGNYSITVTATDIYAVNTIQPYSAANSRTSPLNIINHPPEFSSIEIIYANGVSENCAGPNIASYNCIYSVDNGENASVQAEASDPDQGHTVSYALVEDYEGIISIDAATGLISGLENLNFQSATERTFIIGVTASDQYCGLSESSECSVTASFSLTVMPYCAISNSSSKRLQFSPNSYEITESGQIIALGSVLADCSEVGESNVDIALNGFAHNKAIIFVSDLSQSMDVEIQGIQAIERLKEGLANPINGILRRLYDISLSMPPEINIMLGLVGFNDETPYYYPPSGLVDIKEVGISGLRNEINSYTTDFQTHTLNAMNRAELMLNSVAENYEKVIILMSDGIPGIDCQGMGYSCVLKRCGCGRTCNTGTDKACYFSGDKNDCCNPGRVYCYDGNSTCCPASDPDCCVSHKCSDTGECGIWPDCYECGPSPSQPFCSGATPCGTYPNCTALPPTPSCGPCPVIGQGTCYPYCKPPPCVSGFNTNSDFKIAVTAQTQCVGGNQPTPNPPCASRPCPEIAWNGACAGQTGCYRQQPHFLCTGDYVTGSFFVNCDISADVTTQATALKNNGIEIYSIYYDTGYDDSDLARSYMCGWSSDNTSECWTDGYSHSGIDIVELYNHVITSVLEKPKNIWLNNTITIIDPNPESVTSIIENFDFDPLLSCGISDLNLTVTYNDRGTINFSDLEFYYCPPYLHK